MCIQDLQLARHKYTRLAKEEPGSNQSRRPGSRTTIQAPWPNNGEPELIIGVNNNRVALVVSVLPNASYDTENNHWVINDCLVFGFPIPVGTASVFDFTGPIIPVIVLSNQTKMSDIIRIEDVGNMIYGAWGFISMSEIPAINLQTISVTDIIADREVMAMAQGNTGNVE